MKIVLTAGGTGGHFYPLIAVAEQINEAVKERKLLKPEIYYLGPDPYDEKMLFEHDIEFRKAPAGKVRTYFSLLNFLDTLKTGWGIVRAVFLLFSIFPDVVFSKGGYASFPTTVAARLLGIPVVIHESDTIPGRANLWVAPFARSIGIAYPEAKERFPKNVQEKIALVGNPVRASIAIPAKEGAHEFLKLEENTPVILVLGGSQGAQRINETILEMLPGILEDYQIIHQTGRENYDMVKQTAEVILDKSQYTNRYRAFDYLNDLALRMSAGVASIVITRAGSNAISEVATWGLPSIVVPIDQEVTPHQYNNAFAYARAGAAVVVENKNLEPNLLRSEIDRLMQDEAARKEMGEKAKAFVKPDAARKLAEEILHIGLEHEK